MSTVALIKKGQVRMDAEHRRSASSLLTFFLPSMYVLGYQKTYHSYSIQAPEDQLTSITLPDGFNQAASLTLYLTADTRQRLLQFTEHIGTKENCPWNLTDYVSCIKPLSGPNGRFRAFVNFITKVFYIYYFTRYFLHSSHALVLQSLTHFLYPYP
jgi:hypothetical protein